VYKKYPKGLKLNEESEKLVEKNMGIAHKLASAWTNGVVPYEELRQQAYLVLVDCATKFDPLNGTKFGTYAYNCISIQLNNYVQQYNKIINIPINKIYKMHKYQQLPVEEKEEFKKESKLSDNDVEFYSTYEMISLNQQVDDDYADCSNFYSKDDDGYDRVEQNDSIKFILKNLDSVIDDELDRDVFAEIIHIQFETDNYKDVAKKFNLKLKDIYDIVERCQKIMAAHRNDFI